jgi:hypothetical protein
MHSVPPIRIDYDSNWKIITTNLIEDFIQFFLPTLYNDVDFSVAPEFLEQELFEMVEDEQVKNIMDKLVKLRLKSGEEKWIFVHIEFQNDGNILERMFLYFRRILDKYGKEITAIVIYTGKSVPKHHDKYEYENYGTKVTYQFNSYLVSKQNEAELLSNENPFALVVLANLYVLKTLNDLEQRLSFKENLYNIAQSRQYSIEKTTELFIFVKELMQLSPELEVEYNFFITKQKNVEEMRVASQSMLDLVNLLSAEFYGQTIEDKEAQLQESKVELQESKVELQESKVELQESKVELQDKKLIIARSIINLRDKMNLNATQIADLLDLEITFVESVLNHVKG